MRCRDFELSASYDRVNDLALGLFSLFSSIFYFLHPIMTVIFYLFQSLNAFMHIDFILDIRKREA